MAVFAGMREKSIHFVGLVHIADVPGRHEPGTGEINYHNMLGQLKYDRYVAMECLPTYGTLRSLRTNHEMALGDGRT